MTDLFDEHFYPKLSEMFGITYVGHSVVLRVNDDLGHLVTARLILDKVDIDFPRCYHCGELLKGNPYKATIEMKTAHGHKVKTNIDLCYDCSCPQ